MKYITIPLDYIESGLKLEIYPEGKNQLFEIEFDMAVENGESPYQILEGNSYEFKLSNPHYRLGCSVDSILKTSNRDKSCGRILPGIYVGTLTFFISKDGFIDEEFPIYLEVLATKFNNDLNKSYRENYRFMLESIAEKCTELLTQIDSPVNQHFEPDFENNYKTTYQRFAFIQSLISSKEFNEAIHKIQSSPNTKWEKQSELQDVRKSHRPNNQTIRQLISLKNRFPIPENHYLSKQYGIKDIPFKIQNSSRVEIFDTPENRFIKYILEVFLKFCNDCEKCFSEKKFIRAQKEAAALQKNLDNHLNHSFFKEVSKATTLQLNNPVLQRKSGYCEILKFWLMFGLAAKLIWKGGESVYEAGKRDIAKLYEYWVFFQLLDIVSEIFKLEKTVVDKLIEKTRDGFGLKIKSGKHIAIKGEFQSKGRCLKVEFNYNRTFSYSDDHIKQGSWTSSMRPDYTLSLWPTNFTSEEAEAQELMVHIHFDAKYRIDRKGIFGDEDNTEKKVELNGTWKRDDLLKMHSYRDAIRRTQGAYVLYPGEDDPVKYSGYREILPGLGAFVIKPGCNNSELTNFINDVVAHICDRASARERQNYHIYRAQEEPVTYQVNHPIPECEPNSKQRHSPPSETYILVGWCKSDKHLKWIIDKKLYNFRMDATSGSLRLKPEISKAQYLLLHGDSKAISGLFRIS